MSTRERVKTVQRAGAPVVGRVTIDDAGVGVDATVDGAISIFFDGQRVWSMVPSRDGKRQSGGRRLAEWPTTLRPYLSGHAEISVRRMDTDEELFCQTVSLGQGEGPISVVDAEGVPLAIDKGGHLSKMFGAHESANRQALVAATQQALDILTGLGVPAFLAFGCLLGAVREGRLIGHDNDADIAYVAKSTHPFDVIRESLALERHFHGLGWSSRRMSGGDFKLSAPMPDGTTVGMDVFTAFYQGDVLYLMPSVRAPLAMSSLVPQSTVELEGLTVTAPAEPADLLEATYGPGWRTPDPSFKYTPAPEIRRFLSGVMRGERKHQNYWEEFYALHADAVSQDPSSFARWVSEREPGKGTLLDIGSGTGRDTLWFSSEGFATLGCDYSLAGVEYSSRKAAERALSAEFTLLNLYDLRHVLVRGATFAHERRTDIVYARFLVHAMEDAGREHLWVISRSVLRGTKGRLYLEFRTEATEHEFGEHFRQFVQPDVVVAELGAHGFEIEHCENSYGLAVHKTEDPRVCRIVARMR